MQGGGWEFELQCASWDSCKTGDRILGNSPTHLIISHRAVD